ncbi:hypothetical protein GCM10009836_72350 [Pseudonocardia ailaonensis]|uniref:CBS domain-containing protein n=1 Tax=Pseudonocardia ailaonensis TaxID=367279 RepID=A0ABN2NQJ0_9PSEU
MIDNGTEAPPRPAPPETLDDHPPVRAVMSRQLVAIDPAAPLRTALRLMTAGAVRHLPVVGDGRCVGVVADVDLLSGMVAGRGPFGSAPLLVRDVMRPVSAVAPSLPLADAARRMEAENTDVLVVVEAGSLLGIVTATDLVHAVATRVG